MSLVVDMLQTVRLHYITVSRLQIYPYNVVLVSRSSIIARVSGDSNGMLSVGEKSLAFANTQAELANGLLTWMELWGCVSIG